MKAVLAAILLACLAPGLCAAEGLKPFAWKNRVLLIFADRNGAQVEQQRRLVEEEQAALAERDMVVLLISGETVEPLYGAARGLSAAALRRAAGVRTQQSGFEAVLIGKDGGVKLREQSPVSADALFELIDTMPMRAGERRRAEPAAN